MRNLRILNRGQVVPESRTFPDLTLVNATFDVINNSLTTVLGSPEADVMEVQQMMKDGAVNVLASFPVKQGDTLLSFAHFVDTLQLVFVFASGDIITADYQANTGQDPDSTVTEIVGSIDDGILAASWSPDEETLVLLTGQKNVVLLSRMFEPLSETTQSVDDLKLNTQVSVGWGKKETQFKGKGVRGLERQRENLKHAGLNIDSDHAILRDPTLKELESGELSSLDDPSYCKISWRGDCQYFAITSIDDAQGTLRRAVRIYSRDNQLQACSEPVAKQEGALSWKPQGSLIASVQRRTETDEDTQEQYENLQVIFFERNGLRHGEFETRLAPGAKVYNIDWSSNSEILLLQLDHSVQIWYTKNYHWYLKQELFTANREHINFAKFHPENPYRVMLGTDGGVTVVEMTYCITTGPTAAPFDIGTTLVIDGTTCLMTPLARANVPPPASFRELDVGEPIVDMACSKSNERYAILSNDHLYIAEITIGASISPIDTLVELEKAQFCDYDTDQPRQVAIVNDTVYILVDSQFGACIMSIDISDKPVVGPTIPLATNAVLLVTDSSCSALYYETVTGEVFSLDESIGKFPQLCSSIAVAQVDGPLACGLTSNGKLFIGERQLSTGVTSMLATDSYLLYTTAQQELKFVHLNESLLGSLESTSDGADDERTRMIERGSWLVNSCPSKFSVTLQAPRGNLETIYPRIMVLTGVRNEIKQKHYRNAFLICRTHRIQLDILHDYDPKLFFANVELFINELETTEYLDLFLSCLLDEDVSQTKYKETVGLEKLSLDESKETTKVHDICEAILQVLLQQKYKQKYLQSIITAYACQTPPQNEQALQLISQLKDDQKEKAIEHLCFLEDVNKLYDVALSIYDIPLALAIAQKSQKDPKEYLPFLQKLHTQPQDRKRFMVDTYLKNYTKAFDSLVKITDPGVEKEIEDYTVEHDLYKHALQVYRYDSVKFDKILLLYGNHLHDKSEFVDSALIYDKLALKDQALADYIEAMKWREALALATELDCVKDTAERLVELLNIAHKHSASAEIEYKYLGDTKEALRLYCKAFQFDRAILLSPEPLLKEIIDPGLGEGFGSIAELLAECGDQTRAQLKRLRELREKKEADPYAFYSGNAENTENADNVSIAPTESTLRSSVFTRYTGQTSGTAKTGATRRTVKNRRREERKRARGKKGTIYEEEYLVRSTGRLLDRLDTTMPDAVQLIEGLLRRNMVEQAYQIQHRYVELMTFLKDHVAEIYNMSERDRERVDDRGIVYLIPEIPIPTVKDFPGKPMLDY